MQRKTLIFAFIFLVSRFILINPQPVFFDSPEYIQRFSNPSFFQGIYLGHIPLHLGYVVFFWPIYHIFSYFLKDPLFFVLLFQVILSLMGAFSFYRIVEFISSKKVAFLSLIIISFLPLYWITNVSIMMEGVYIPFFLISLYFLIKYLKTEKWLNILLFSFFWGFSFLTHSAILLWTPFILYLIFIKNRRNIAKLTIVFVLTFILFSLINAFFVSVLTNRDILQGALDFYLKPLEARANLNFSFTSLKVSFRNFIVPLLRNNTSLIVILSFISLFSIFKKNKQLFIFFILWIIPAVITNQWWDSLFFGRHALLASFAFAFLVSTLIYKHRSAVIFVIFYLAITVIPAVSLIKFDIPYLVLKNEVKNLPINGLYIESHFARPQLDNIYLGNQYFVSEPSYAAINLIGKIDEKLNKKLPVFISSQALSEPYGLYSGPFLHNLGLSYKNGYLLENIIKNYTVKPYKIINSKDNLIIYKIKSKEKSPYPKFKLMKESERRIDFYDPLFKLWMFLIKI